MCEVKEYGIYGEPNCMFELRSEYGVYNFSPLLSIKDFIKRYPPVDINTKISSINPIPVAIPPGIKSMGETI